MMVRLIGYGEPLARRHRYSGVVVAPLKDYVYIKEKGFPLFPNSLAISSIIVLLLRTILHFGLPSSRRRDDVVLLVLYTTIHLASISRLLEKSILTERKRVF